MQPTPLNSDPGALKVLNPSCPGLTSSFPGPGVPFPLKDLLTTASPDSPALNLTSAIPDHPHWTGTEAILQALGKPIPYLSLSISARTDTTAVTLQQSTQTRNARAAYLTDLLTRPIFSDEAKASYQAAREFFEHPDTKEFLAEHDKLSKSFHTPSSQHREAAHALDQAKTTTADIRTALEKAKQDFTAFTKTPSNAHHFTAAKNILKHAITTLEQKLEIEIKGQEQLEQVVLATTQESLQAETALKAFEEKSATEMSLYDVHNNATLHYIRLTSRETIDTLLRERLPSYINRDLHAWIATARPNDPMLWTLVALRHGRTLVHVKLQQATEKFHTAKTQVDILGPTHIHNSLSGEIEAVPLVAVCTLASSAPHPSSQLLSKGAQITLGLHISPPPLASGGQGLPTLEVESIAKAFEQLFHLEADHWPQPVILACPLPSLLRSDVLILLTIIPTLTQPPYHLLFIIHYTPA